MPIEDDSWELFEKKGGDSVKYPRVQPVAKKVAKSYDGLSLLIVNVVEAMKNQDLNAWKDALEQVTSFELEGYFYSSVRYAIELSYDHLENHELKIFFLLLGSMGKDCTTRDSLVSGWCLGLHKHVDTLANGRNRLYILIDNLRATSLLVDEGQRDLVVALDVCFIREIPEILECPKLKILQLNSQDIAIIGEITSLDILNLEKSELRELLVEIGGLSNLRLLDLTYCSTLGVIPHNLISSLTSLEELYMGNNNVQEKIEDTSDFLRDYLGYGRLESYKILIGDGWKWSGVESGNYVTSRLLKLNLGADLGIVMDYGIKIALLVQQSGLIVIINVDEEAVLVVPLKEGEVEVLVCNLDDGGVDLPTMKEDRGVVVEEETGGGTCIEAEEDKGE
ncbi:Disease resistance protein [Glycine soja]|uniref:Disease resistance protein n=1 Tax=Glycine soja TaxID=3848 RepID=A0A0B2PCG3_GLYSO|nr:Disease resistance protein [Glycine soja]